MKEILKKQWKLMIIFILFSFLLSIVEVSFAYVIQYFIDSLESVSIEKFQISVLFFITFLLSNYFFSMLVIWIQSTIIKNIHISLKSKLAKYFLYQCYSDSTKTTTGEKMNYFEYHVSMIEQYYVESILTILQSSLSLLISTIYLYVINPIICLMVLSLGIISMAVPLLLGNKLNELVSQNANLSGEYLQFLKEIFQGIIVIKSFKKEKIFFEQFKSKLLRFERNSQLLNVKNGKYNQVSGLFQYAVVISCLGLGGFLVLTKVLTLSKMIAITQVSNLIVEPIQRIGNAVIDISASKNISREITSMIANISIYNQLENSHINFRNVLISTERVIQDDNEILSNLKAYFESGKKYCIVGPNGSGKSTLGRLMLNLLNNVQVQVVINKKDYELKALSQLISYIPQTSFAFKGTVKDNISLFEKCSMVDITKVMEFVNLNKDVLNLSYVSENGDNLSGGELKKINIARALIKDKPILLIDEFESALDEESQKVLTTHFFELNKCLIIISHNLDSYFLSKFDSIIFMEKGDIVAEGKFEDLMQSSKQFYNFIMSNNRGDRHVHNVDCVKFE